VSVVLLPAAVNADRASPWSTRRARPGGDESPNLGALARSCILRTRCAIGGVLTRPARMHAAATQSPDPPGRRTALPSPRASSADQGRLFPCLAALGTRFC
jgi:hypothetical protein